MTSAFMPRSLTEIFRSVERNRLYGYTACMASAEKRSRADLIAALDMAGRVHSSAAVMYHSALAALGDLSATESKAMDYLERFGPLTPRELGRHSGLAPASVTGLIDRLERKGFARRVPNPDDGRSRLVELNRDRIAPMAHHFDDLVSSLHELYETYTDEQLELIAGFLAEAARRQSEATGRLGQAAPEVSRAGSGQTDGPGPGRAAPPG
jgi:DNA-binding MarR family transcriptional regulator